MLRIAPPVAAGVCGMTLVALLTVAQELLVQAHGRGLGAEWLLLLPLPGMLAAHLIWRQGEHDPQAAVRSGLMAGVIMGHLAAPLLVLLLVVAVATTDWAGYAGLVGPEIADAVHSAAWPAAAFLGAVAAVVGYVGCTIVGLVGALAYMGLRSVIK